MWSVRTAIAALVITSILALVTGRPLQAPTLADARGCPVFPERFPINERVDRLPVAPNSTAIIRSIGIDGSIHPDFGSGTWGGRPAGPRRTRPACRSCRCWRAGTRCGAGASRTRCG